MVKLQPVHTSIMSEDDTIRLTIYNRPSYGVEWLTAVMGDRFPGIEIHAVDRADPGIVRHFILTIPSADHKSKYIRGEIGRLIEAASAREGEPMFEDPGRSSIPPHLRNQPA